MSNLTSVVYNEAAGTVYVGSGRTWDQVYAILEKDNVTVTGGRVPGVGKTFSLSERIAILIFFRCWSDPLRRV